MVGFRGPGSRTLRRLLLGSGPLRRGSDRLEVLGGLAAVLMVVLAVPVALAVGTAVWTDSRAQASEQAVTRTLTEAVLTADAQGSPYAAWTSTSTPRAGGPGHRWRPRVSRRPPSPRR